MGNPIIYHNGAYNLYTTIGDGPWFEEALTLEELKEFIKEEYGRRGMEEFPQRLERAHKTGTSAHGLTLSDQILCNQCGEGCESISEEEFIRRYLTLPAEETEEEKANPVLKDIKNWVHKRE
jgi:hypothetical protein